MRRSELRVKLRKIGTGQGVLISRSICGLMGVKVGDELLVEFDNGGIRLCSTGGEPVEKGKKG